MKRKRVDWDKAPDWPPFRYEAKENYIKIISPSGSRSKLISPARSSHRLYEIFKVAHECLILNVQFPLITPCTATTEAQVVPQFSIVTPTEYESIFRALNLHKLPLEVMTIRYPGHPADGQTRGICIVCLRDLIGKQKLYCSEECHNVWKHRQALERGRKAVRGSSSKESPRCPDCHHLKALHKTGKCFFRRVGAAKNCDCKA